MTMLPSPTIVYMSKVDLLDVFREAYECGFQDGKKSSKKIDAPMNREETAKYLKCSTATIDRHWRHLRHQPKNGHAYWLASEISEHIKRS